MDLSRHKKRVLYRAKTRFNNLVVTKQGEVVTLWSPPSVMQSSVDLSNPTTPQLEYARRMLFALVFCPRPKSILVMGLGGGTIPMLLHHHRKNARIDVIEIDPELPAIAKRYFGFTPSKGLRVIVDDAFKYIQRSKKNYDVIIMDAYSGGRLQKGLGSREFFEGIRERLAKGGVLLTNLLDIGKSNYRRVSNIINNLFAGMWLLPGEDLNNTIVFSNHNRLVQRELQTRASRLAKNGGVAGSLPGLVRKLRRYR